MEAGTSDNVESRQNDVVAKKPKLNSPESLPNRKLQLQNIVSALRNSEISGRHVRRIDKLPAGYIASSQSRFKDVNGLPSNVLDLFRHFKKEKINFQDERLNSCIEEIYDLLLNDSKAPKAALEFYYLGGVEIIVDILVKAYYEKSCDITKEKAIKTLPKEDLKVVKLMIETIYTSAQMAPIGLSHLSRHPYLLHLLFSLLVEEEKRTFTDVTLLLEEIILSEVRKSEIDLTRIACLPAILEKNVSHQQEAHIYHILATTVSMGDSSITVDTSLQEHDNWLMSSRKSQLNKTNQEYLVSFTSFLKKLFQLSSFEFRLELPPLLQDAIRILTTTHEMEENQIVQMYTRLIEDSPDSSIYQANLYQEKSIRADAFLLLSMLLTGKCREEMQKNVIKFELVRGLEKTVDPVVWSSVNGEAFPDHLHGDYGVHSPETTVKIQYLRLIYSISDHHLHRYLLLSSEELEEIKSIAENNDIKLYEDFHSVIPNHCCQKNPGLLTQIIEKMKHESANSYIRFWMTRALESFLRGATCIVDQLFFIKKGLLEELFRILLSNERVSTEVIQGHFDLLASLMKCNFFAFEQFNKHVDCLGKFQKLCRIIENNLVDSNMFVRCVILTLFQFETTNTPSDHLVENCRVLKCYSDFSKRIQVIVSLVGLLNVKTLSQENVSCLNTSLIILLVALKTGQLPKYLSFIMRHNDETLHSGTEILENLRELLQFWLEHYSYTFKANDVKSLEESTGFPFSEWKTLTQLLISDDATIPTSIFYHLSSTSSALPLKATVVSCARSI